ncbi:MAG: hypothetical protein PHC61_03220 [Chitinivibrionales bacterium]|nr:hypothetical protein [Chitinivibrionales bacterium]
MKCAPTAIIFLTAFLTSAFAEDLDYANYDLPQILFYNPSLIVRQQDNLAGVLCAAPAAALSDSLALSAAFIKTFGAAGFGLGYNRNTGAYPNVLSAAFSHTVNNFYWGMGAHIGFSAALPGLCIDAAAAYCYRPDHLVTLAVKNVVTSDTALPGPAATISWAGALPSVSKLNCQIDIGAQAKNYAAAQVLYDFELHLYKSWFKRPMITLGGGIGMEYLPQGLYTLHETGSVHLDFNGGPARLGLEAGLSSRPTGRTIFASLSCAPVRDAAEAPPVFELRVVNDSVTTDPANAAPTILAITAKGTGGASTIDHWQVLICAVPAAKADQVVRSFMGGALPPSTVLWDGRDQRGELVKPALYFACLVTADLHGNEAQTPWQTIVVK